DNKNLLNAVFHSWRWSPECLNQWSEWIKGVSHPNCLEASVKWLAIIYVASEEKSNALDAEFVPQIPEWPTERIPDISWLPRKNADVLVFSALANAAMGSQQTGKIFEMAQILLEREVQSLRSVHAAGREQLRAAYISLGDALVQEIGHTPEEV